MGSTGFVTFVVDDDKAILRSLSRLLAAKGYEVRPYESAEVFLADHDPTVPGCAILDVSMPGLNGLDVQKALSREHAVRPIVFLSGSADIPDSVQAMKEGAVDFLTKPVKSADLLAAIAVACDRYATAIEQGDKVEELRARLAKLTPRERQVLDGVVAGRMNKQIAGDIGISLKTTKMHRSSMMKKMNVKSVADLVRLASIPDGGSTGLP